MSLVYRAKDVYLNRVVAVKVLREHLTGDEEFVNRFRREAQAVASLSHENIVSVYDVGKDDNVYYLVMEMVEGRNLKEIIRERGPLPVAEAVDIAEQICDALAHAHEHKIIHRDIKPHNIIITEQGKAKVTDFGIARAVSTATVTHTGSIMGSVHYFSPEQAKGEIADEKSDIYSLGVLIYEMLTGVLPFEGESPISVAMKKIHSDPAAPRQFNSQINEAMEQAILTAMNREPRLRYPNVQMLKADLQSALKYNRLEYGPIAGKLSDDTITVPQVHTRRLSRRNKAVKDGNKAAGRAKYIFIISGLAVIGFTLGMYLSALILAGSEVAVPNIKEKTVEEAQKALEDVNLTLEVAGTVNHPTIAKGLIISQEPESATIVKKNSTVRVQVSGGILMVTVPDVTEASLLSAEIALQSKGLLVGEVRRAYHSQIPSGQVIQQDPGSDQEIPQGSSVNLIVSKGPEPVWVEMPSLIGLDLEEAQEIIKSLKLLQGVIDYEASTRYEKGLVIRQDPGADSEILQNTVVNMVVSSGPGPRQQKQKRVLIDLTSSGPVKIIVEDDRGRTVAYERYHNARETVDRNVSYYGQGYIEVYVNNILQRREPVS